MHEIIELVTTSEAGEILSLSGERVRQLAEAGTLPPAITCSLGRLFDRRAVEAFGIERAQRKIATRAAP